MKLSDEHTNEPPTEPRIVVVADTPWHRFIVPALARAGVELSDRPIEEHERDVGFHSTLHPQARPREDVPPFWPKQFFSTPQEPIDIPHVLVGHSGPNRHERRRDKALNRRRR